jgi:hypothetical protein
MILIYTRSLLKVNLNNILIRRHNSTSGIYEANKFKNDFLYQDKLSFKFDFRVMILTNVQFIKQDCVSSLNIVIKK